MKARIMLANQQHKVPSQHRQPLSRSATAAPTWHPQGHGQHGASNWNQTVRFAGILIAILVTVYVLVGVGVNYAADRLSDETETQLFAGYSKIFLKPEAAATPKKVNFLTAEGIFKRLTERKDLRKLNYQLFYDDSSLPNAFAAPGGGVSITAGLLDMVTGEVGLAMVLGHELGHHQARHALRGLGRGIALSLIIGVFFGGDNALVTGALGLAEASHSRSQEHAADAMGLKLVYETMGTTKGAFEFFEDIHKLKEKGDSKFARLMSSHPYTPDRIAALRKLEVKLISKPEKKSRQPNN